jgi:hypothetical protein
VAPPRAASKFATDGVAFLQKHCLRCHGDKVQQADLSLHVYRNEASVLKDRKVWQSVLKMVSSGEMPPRRRPRPAPAEVQAFVQSVQAIFAQAAHNARDPGQVTLRRLNRAEYNNTIRDLIGVDFNPAEDFPADGVGYGFDNIGDVLSLSPVLLERYLAAAETIAQHIHLTPPKRVFDRTDALFLRPQGNDLKDGFRPLFTRGKTLHMELPPGHDGEYVVRGRVYGKQVGDEPVKAALLLDGKELKTFDVKTDSAKTAEVIEVKVTLQPGPHPMRFSIGLVNEFKSTAGQRTLWVKELEVTGPPDNRPAAQRRLFPVDPSRSKRERSPDLLARFATKAYRRPATPVEVERLVKLAEAAEARGKKWEDAVKLAVQAVLVSPKFLFRIELDDRPDSTEPHPLGDYQFASRLSYFLWSSMPDDELFALAEKNILAKHLDAQVRRMLKDSRAQALVDNFALQWLQLRRLQVVTPDAKLFPAFNEPLRKAMLRETELFFEAVLLEKKELFSRCLAEKMLTYALGRGVEFYDMPAIDRITAALARDYYRISTLVSEIARSDPFRLRRGKR